MIGALISGGIGLVRDWFQNKREQVKADHEITLAEKQNRARLLRDEQSNNHDWEMANLADKDRFMRRASFVLFSLPFLWAMFDAPAVKEYFDTALEAMPQWYVQLYLVIIGGVWGVAALKNNLASLFNAVRKKP